MIIGSNIFALDDNYHHHLSIRNKYKKMWRVFCINFSYDLQRFQNRIYFYIYRLTLICELINIICENRDGHGGGNYDKNNFQYIVMNCIWSMKTQELTRIKQLTPKNIQRRNTIKKSQISFRNIYVYTYTFMQK